MSGLSIMILDDERALADELGEYLTSLGHTCAIYYRPSEALSALERLAPEIMLLDLKLPEMDGLTVLERVRAQAPRVEVIVMSGHGDIDSVTRAFRLGAFDFLHKSFTPADVQLALERTSTYQALRRRYEELESRHSALTDEVARATGTVFLGTSPAALAVLDLAERAAAHGETSVLISGESGTGKELLARMIHYRSTRRERSLVTVNCAAVSGELFESEFFGHIRGAYTGAVGARAGYLRKADGGTLFLDEVGELPPAMQAKLLRVLEYGTFMPVGSDDEVSTDVRIVAATNRDLDAATRSGRFRVDLYYRLQAFEIRVPPLRERAEDIPLLVRHFREEFVRQMGHPAPMSDDELTAGFVGYGFPGNVRELRNAVERAMIIGAVDVGGSLGNESEARPGDGNDRPDDLERSPSSADLDLGTIEREAIVEALHRTGGVYAAAARLLGVTRQSLARRMDKHGLS